jgi:hypothetical protein
MLESCKQEIDDEYNELVSGINNVAISEDIKIVLATDKYGDFSNLIHRDFHIDQSVRKNFKKIMTHAPKS